ncbi:hypothetical protein I553_6776 [Mycobacterium xenopi 4042]|uniref:DUF58 domain-containing protein n=1 Tax=Mycobacterium xenopi 4042 TaxID=1299334 RepID=X7Z2G4_MYCXE|nr:hypothetical protein I553_6776 [Mycobacterium xenopi 4042]
MVARGGLLTGTATVDVAEVVVFPVAPPQSTVIPQTELLDRLGTHLTRHIGSGVEYADIRAYVPGDQLRTINWPVSARRRSLHVTQRLTDRAADVVVLIDTYPQPAGRRRRPPSESCGARRKWCRRHCAAATAPGSSHSVDANHAGLVQISGSGNFIVCSTLCSPQVRDSKRPAAPWHRARRCLPAPLSSRFRRCSTRNSHWR